MLFSFFQNWILSFVREKGGEGGSVEGQKMAQNDQKLSVSFPISRTVPHMFLVFGTRVKWSYLQQIFSFFNHPFPILKFFIGPLQQLFNK